MSNLLTEKQGRLNYLRGQAKSLFDSKPNLDFTADEAAQAKSWNDEMGTLGTEIDQIKSLASMRADIMGAEGTPVVGDEPTGAKADGRVEAKSLREIISSSEEYKAFQKRGSGTAAFDIDMKTLITLSTVSPQATLLSRIEPYPVERRTVADLMAQGTIDRGTLQYFEETTFTNAAVEVAEGEDKPEAALDWTERTESVGKIAVWIPATTESLADVSWLESTIKARLLTMLERRKEAQLLNGDGTAPNISGITDRANLQTQAKGADPVFDAILKAATKIQVNAMYDPDAVVMHPNDWQDILLTRTTDGIYILGSPADPQATRRLWGLEVRATTAQTQNTAIVGAFRTASQIFQREIARIVVSTEHADYFIKNRVAVLAEERLALAVYSGAAFCTVTGI